MAHLSLPVNFSSLTNTADINLTSPDSLLHTPVLAKANSISVATDGDVHFPALINASDVHMQGRTSSYVTFPSTYSRHKIHMQHPHTSRPPSPAHSGVSLPNLQYLNQCPSLEIYLPVDCTSREEVFDHTSALFAEQHGYKSAAHQSRTFECPSVVDDGKKGLSRDVKDKMGFGLGLRGEVAVLGLVLVLRLVLKRKVAIPEEKGGPKKIDRGESRSVKSEERGDRRLASFW
ncbi:hypothetical protein EYC84_009628 [Monilinia fructicola]|uniref:Uncharacterized protein n=1 Tax=Monilinia fructicola TaxID=38448 RepID=A0A5M9J8G9_MONFR|nr:hypothetical protein EYC84_009628 [Monilinia fructicola]